MYSIELSVRVQNFINRLEDSIKERVIKRIKRLKENPVPSDAKFIGRHNNKKVFRYRIGDYGALYKIKEKQKIILITKLNKRPKIYK